MQNCKRNGASIFSPTAETFDRRKKNVQHGSAYGENNKILSAERKWEKKNGMKILLYKGKKFSLFPCAVKRKMKQKCGLLLKAKGDILWNVSRANAEIDKSRWDGRNFPGAIFSLAKATAAAKYNILMKITMITLPIEAISRERKHSLRQISFFLKLPPNIDHSEIPISFFFRAPSKW